MWPEVRRNTGRPACSSVMRAASDRAAVTYVNEAPETCALSAPEITEGVSPAAHTPVHLAGAPVELAQQLVACTDDTMEHSSAKQLQRGRGGGRGGGKGGGRGGGRGRGGAV